MSWELSSYSSTYVLILFPGSIVRSGLHSSLFFTISSMWFLLVRLACMAILTGLWHRLSNLTFFPLGRGGKARAQTGFYFTMQKRPVPGSSGASLAKRPHLESGNEAHPSGKKSAGGSVSTSSLLILGGKGAVGVGTPDVSQSLASSSSSSAVFWGGMLFKVFDQCRSIMSITSLCLICFGVTIFSLGTIIPCSVTSGSSMSRQL